MKVCRRWLALILAVVLVGSNAIYSMSSSLMANVQEGAESAAGSEIAEEVVTQEDIAVDNSAAEGIGVEIMDETPIAAEGEKPPAEPAPPEVPAEPAPTETPNESVTPVKKTYTVVINKPTEDGGTAKIWTTGEKTDVVYNNEENRFTQEITEGTPFYMEITTNGNYEIEKLSDQNGTVIEPKEVNGKVYTYELLNLAESKELNVLYKEVVQVTPQEPQTVPEELQSTQQQTESASKARSANQETLSVEEKKSSGSFIEVIKGSTEMKVGDTIELQCSQKDHKGKDHQHSWYFDSKYFKQESKDGGKLRLEAIRNTSAPIVVSCDRDNYLNNKITISIAFEAAEEQQAVFYILKPGVDMSSVESGAIPLDEAWYNAGWSTVNAPKVDSLNYKHKFSDWSMITETPDSYPIIQDQNGQEYSYSINGEYGTYSLEYDKIIVENGANAGINNNTDAVVSAGENGKIYHIDAIAHLQNKEDHTVTFKVQEPDEPGFANADNPVRVKKGTEKKKLTVPTLEKEKEYNGKTFKLYSWFEDEACTQKADFSSGIVDKDVTYYARYISEERKVSYYVNYQGELCEKQDTNVYAEEDKATVLDGSYLDQHDSSERHVFVGWTTNKNLVSNTQGIANKKQYQEIKSQLYNYPQQITIENSDIKFYAIYAIGDEIGRVTLNYEACTGGSVSPAEETIMEVGPVKGSKASPNQGYKFVNWTDADGNVLSTNPDFVPLKDITTGRYEEGTTYYANFAPNTARAAIWFYSTKDEKVRMVTTEEQLSETGANKYEKVITQDNRVGYTEQEVKDAAAVAYGLTEEEDRYEHYEIQVLHKGANTWEEIKDLGSYTIQDGDEIRYHVVPEGTHTLTYEAGAHSAGKPFNGGSAYRGDSILLKAFEETGLEIDRGYKFAGWKLKDGDDIITGTDYKMGDQDVVLEAVCVKDESDTETKSFEVQYYKNNVIDEAATHTISALVWVNDDQIPVKAGDINTTDKYPGYTFVDTTPTVNGGTVTAGSIIKVFYKANTDTAYNISTYYEKDGKYEENCEKVITKTGTTDTLVDTTAHRIPEANRGAYVYDSVKSAAVGLESGLIQGNGQLELKVYFKQQFAVKYKPGEKGTFEEQETKGLSYGADMPQFKGVPTGESGYTFAGWSPVLLESGKVTKDETFIAQWVSNEDTTYKIEYYLQKDGQYPAQTDIVTSHSGKTDSEASVTEDQKKPTTTAYTFDEKAANVLSGTIKGDGTLVLKVYFKQQFTVRYTKGMQGIFDVKEYVSLSYGDETPAYGAETPAGASGYSFAGWAPEPKGTMVEKDAVYVAQWSANPNTAYTVAHYQEDLSGDYQKVDADTENLTGETGKTAEANAKSYTGFTYNTDKSTAAGTITGDGKLKLKLYYARNSQTVTYLLDGKQYGDKDSYKYGEETKTLREKPSKEGNTFNGWDGTLPETMGTEDIVLSGSYSINSYNVTYQVDGEAYGVPELHEYKSQVILKAEPTTKEGYTFSGWSPKENFTMPAEDVTIEGSFKADDFDYTVNYYYDNEPAEEETIHQKAEFNSVITADAPKTKERNNSNYMLADGGVYKLTIGANVKQNIINVYYVVDNNGPEGQPDGIPDAEEFAVVYHANTTNAAGETVDTNIYPAGYQITFKENGFRNTGNSFTAWGSEANGGRLYQPNEKAEMLEGGINVYAQWAVTEQGTTPETPGTPGTPATPGTPGTPAAATPAPVTPVTVLQTITEPITAAVEAAGEALNAAVQPLVQSDDEGVPLANRASKDHKCCILHLLLLLLALMVEIRYTKSVKRRQERIFELREELAMLEKQIESADNEDEIAS